MFLKDCYLRDLLESKLISKPENAQNDFIVTKTRPNPTNYQKTIQENYINERYIRSEGKDILHSSDNM